MPSALSCLLLVLIAATAAAAPADEPVKRPPTTVSVDGGLVCGEVLDEDRGLRVYRGIPYAAPPVGDLRWRPPAPVASWPGVRVCRTFGPVCPQPDFRYGENAAALPQSEDCLTLNVWTAAKPAERQAVMVWIHGGGFVIGAGSLRVYDGASLAGNGIVLVTINYRLGPLGFMAHPLLSAESPHGVSGNYGILDQIAALGWVKRNIARFGGDPGRVTIFGESAGGVAVSSLMVCPLAKGLFHRAIAQSGTATMVRQRLKTARGREPALQAQGERLAAKLGVAKEKDVLAALRRVDVERLLEVARPAPASVDLNRKYGPVIDGHVFPDGPGRLWAEGKQHDVPFMTGTTADDGFVFSRNVKVPTPLAYRWIVKALYREDADAVLDLFPVRKGEKPKLAMRRLLTVSAFVHGSRTLARAMEEVESPAWLYHFTRVPPIAKRLGIGAAHGIEIPYIFGTSTMNLRLEKTDLEVSEAIQACWIRFAATGNPNPTRGEPLWPRYTTKGDGHLEFGDEVRAGAKLFEKECDLFDGVRRRQQEAEEPR